MTGKDAVCVLFVRPPILGRVKTRLAKTIGEKQALAVYRLLLQQLGRLCRNSGFVWEVHSSQKEGLFLLQEFFPETRIFVQQGEGLGARMANAIAEASKRNSGLPVLLFGSDIPLLNESLLCDATRILQNRDAVLGPTEDGGYYLVGFSGGPEAKQELLFDVFSSIQWSKEDVFLRQCERFERAGLRFSTIKKLWDIDEAGDLFRWARLPASPARHFGSDIRAVLPVYNEKENLEFVLPPLFQSHYFQEILCADNGSTDGSQRLAKSLGARVTVCRERGYGATCLAAIEDIRKRGGCDVLLFLDADGADDPADIPRLLAPILSGEADFVLGARIRTRAEPGSLLLHQRLGNLLATLLIQLLFGHRFFDLGPMRAIRFESYEKLKMEDRNFGWTIQMQLRALKRGLRICEIPVSYRKRHAGRSKVTATLKGSLRAGWVILSSVFREKFKK